MITRHHIIIVESNVFAHLDGIRWAVAQKIAEWTQNLLFPVKVARQKLAYSHTAVTPITGMPLILAHIPDPFQKLLSFKMDHKGVDINHEDETFYPAW